MKLFQDTAGLGIRGGILRKVVFLNPFGCQLKLYSPAL